MPRYRVAIGAQDYDALADLVRKYKVIVARHTVERRKKGDYTVRAHATGGQIHRLRTAGYTVRQYENVDKQGKTRQLEFKRRRRNEESAAVLLRLCG